MDFKFEKNRIYLEDEDNSCIAEATFPDISENTVDVDHTYVHPSLRGQGVAEKLMLALAEELRKNKKKAVATCPYAVKWFEKHEDFQDVYAGK